MFALYSSADSFAFASSTRLLACASNARRLSSHSDVSDADSADVFLPKKLRDHFFTSSENPRLSSLSPIMRDFAMCDTSATRKGASSLANNSSSIVATGMCNFLHTCLYIYFYLNIGIIIILSYTNHLF